MKIRIRTNLGTVEFPDMPWQCGEEREVDDTLGASLIARGVAEDMAPPPPPAPKLEPAPPKPRPHLRGVERKPSIAETIPPAVSGGQPKAE